MYYSVINLYHFLASRFEFLSFVFSVTCKLFGPRRPSKSKPFSFSDSAVFLLSRIQSEFAPLCFHMLTHSFLDGRRVMPSFFNSFRTVSENNRGAAHFSRFHRTPGIRYNLPPYPGWLLHQKSRPRPRSQSLRFKEVKG